MSTAPSAFAQEITFTHGGITHSYWWDYAFILNGEEGIVLIGIAENGDYEHLSFATIKPDTTPWLPWILDPETGEARKMLGKEHLVWTVAALFTEVLQARHPGEGDEHPVDQEVFEYLLGVLLFDPVKLEFLQPFTVVDKPE